VISFDEADTIVRQESRRWAGYSEPADRRQDCWVILLEHDPSDPALARTILRRRLANARRDASARKRGAGFAIGRLDAGWDEEIGTNPTDEIENRIARKEVLTALNYKTFTGSRQAIHQAISRAKSRWARLRKPFDL
jgi:hypothetical protein